MSVMLSTQTNNEMKSFLEQNFRPEECIHVSNVVMLVMLWFIKDWFKTNNLYTPFSWKNHTTHKCRNVSNVKIFMQRKCSYTLHTLRILGAYHQ